MQGITGTVGVLLNGWRTMSGWERDGHPGRRAWNTLVDKLNRTAEGVVADPDGVAALHQIATEDPDPAVRRRARQFLTPWVPRPDSTTDLARWMSHPLIDITSITMRPRISLALIPDEEPDNDPGADLSETSLTWLRGEPLTTTGQNWPRRADGIPLAHLAQAEIGNQPLLQEQYQSFPDTGVLQFFHDLETTGDHPDDHQSGAWQVRLHTEPAADLLRRPDDLGDDAFGDRWRAEMTGIWTFPASDDLDLTEPDAERLDIANLRVRETLDTQWGAWEKTGPVPQYPLMLGYGPETAGHAAELLQRFRPLRSAADHHVLLLTIPGEGPLDGWLADPGHLEFWIRESDLNRNAFDEVWALLR